MCDPATVGLIITAVSGGTKAINTNQALRRQDKQAAEGIRRQGLIQSGASRRVGEQIEDVRASTGAGERAESLEGFLNALRESRAETEGPLAGVPGASERFAERVTSGKEQLRQAGTEQAGRLSRIDAPIIQRQREGGRVGRTASDISEFGRQSTVEDFLTRLRVASERPNALIDVLATVGQGVGSALTLGGGSLFGGGANLGKLAKAGTLIDAPVGPLTGTPFNPFSAILNA